MCTGIRFTDSNGSMYFGRNLDWTQGYGERVVVTPTHFFGPSWQAPVSVRKMPLGQAKPTDFVIKISRHYDISERQVQNVLLHEMIHYYIAFKGIRDTSPHGRAFKSLMHTLNSRHGWDITVSSRRAPAKEGGRPTLRKRLVLAVTMNDGGHFLSVVNPAYRATLDSQARQESIIACHRWIESDDQFFHNFPTVRSLRGCKVDKATFDEKVAAGRPA